MSKVIYIQTGSYNNQVVAKNRIIIKQQNKANKYTVKDISNSFVLSVETQQPSNDMSVYQNRLNTFVDWNVRSISPAQMANAGFYYLGREDLVVCSFCSKEFFDWFDSQNPLVVHKRSSPDCDFFKIIGRDVCGMELDYIPPVDQEVDDDVIKVQTFLFNVGVQQKNIIYLHNKTFTSFEDRMKTFENCKIAINQDIITLSKAGFHYIGDGDTDMMLCFCCDQDFMDWKSDENPWIEHARISPCCSFLLLTKGNDFVRKVIEDMTPNLSRDVRNKLSIGRGDQSHKDNKNRSGGTLNLSRRRESREEPTCSKKLNILRRIQSCLPRPDSFIWPDSLLCKICFKEKMEVLFIPCGHIIACIQCAVTLDDCAVCRKKFHMTMKMFIYAIEICENKSNQMACFEPQISVDSVEATICKMCRKEEMGVAFIPCRHIFSCFACSVKQNICPVCFQPFFALIQVYL